MPVNQPAADFQTLEVFTTWGSIRIVMENGRVAECSLPHLEEAPEQPFRLTETSESIPKQKAGVARASIPMERAPADGTRPAEERLLYSEARSEARGSHAPHPEIIQFIETVFQGLKVKVPMIGNLPGTDFQRSVWRAMAAIPLGQTRTYGELAAAIGNPRAVRAVGSACGANPVPLFIPCHRVVAANGLGGFGSGLPWKKLLLRAEGAI